MESKLGIRFVEKHKMVLAGVLGSLLLVALIAYFVVGYARAASDSVANAATTQEAQSFPDPVECASGQLEADLLAPELTVRSGAEWKVKVRLSNREPDKPCYRVLKASELGVRIYSGPQLYWDSTRCVPADKETKLLLARDISYESELVWPAKLFVECEPKEIAKPGGYQAVAVYQGVEVGQRVSFLVQ